MSGELPKGTEKFIDTDVCAQNVKAALGEVIGDWKRHKKVAHKRRFRLLTVLPLDLARGASCA
jgi:hypothetical protein